MLIGDIGLILMLFFLGSLIFGGMRVEKTLPITLQDLYGTSTTKQAFPREILDQRYARGNISRDEDKLIKSDLV